MTVNASTTLDAPERAKMLIWENFIFELGDWIMSRWFLEAKCYSLCSLCSCTVLTTYNQYNSEAIGCPGFSSNRYLSHNNTNKHKQVWILRNGRTCPTYLWRGKNWSLHLSTFILVRIFGKYYHTYNHHLRPLIKILQTK
jgi:hypothetical protein